MAEKPKGLFAKGLETLIKVTETLHSEHKQRKEEKRERESESKFTHDLAIETALFLRFEQLKKASSGLAEYPKAKVIRYGDKAIEIITPYAKDGRFYVDGTIVLLGEEVPEEKRVSKYFYEVPPAI